MGSTDIEKCNKMSWVKCNGCEHFFNIAANGVGIVYMCNITGKQIKMVNCKYCDEQEEG